MRGFPLAEKFKAPQGEGVFAGTPMAFIRFVGCSVGQKVCTACDTDFSRMAVELGGGLHSPEEIAEWVAPYRHACLTGGEPLDRDLRPVILALLSAGVQVHVETSGTVEPEWLCRLWPNKWIVHCEPSEVVTSLLHVCVSPKPGFSERLVQDADEVKVVLGGLGDGPGWPTMEDAVRWAGMGKTVYVQPRNERLDINGAALREALAVVDAHPSLRLSVQLHKFLRTR